MALEQLGDSKMSKDYCCGKCQPGCCIYETDGDIEYEDMENEQEFFDFNDDAESTKVAVSSVSENEILIYDECQRFVPVYYLDITSLIARLSKYYNYLNIKNNKIKVVNPDDIVRNKNCQLEVLLTFKNNPDVRLLQYFSESEFFENWLPINKDRINTCEVRNNKEKYKEIIQSILLGE